MLKSILNESHFTSVNFDLSDTVVCIIYFNYKPPFANENSEKLSWRQIIMFNYTLFWEYFTAKIFYSIFSCSWF